MVAVSVPAEVEYEDAVFVEPFAPAENELAATTASPLALYVSHLRPAAAVRAYANLGRAAAFVCGGPCEPADVPWHLLRPEQAAVVRDWARSCNPARTANAILTSLRGVIRWAERSGAVPQEDAHALRRSLGPVSATSRAGRSLSSRGLEWLLAVCEDDTPAGARDALLLALVALGGLCPVEVASLAWSDFDRERGLLLAKSRHQGAGRALVLDDGVTRRIDAWRTYAAEPDGPMFTSLRGGGTSSPLTGAGINAIVRKRAFQAGRPQLRSRDLVSGYWYQLLRRPIESGHAPSLLVFEEGAAWLATDVLTLS